MPDIDQRWCRPGRRNHQEGRQHANFQMVVKVFDLCHGGILPLYTQRSYHSTVYKDARLPACRKPQRRVTWCIGS